MHSTSTKDLFPVQFSIIVEFISFILLHVYNNVVLGYGVLYLYWIMQKLRTKAGSHIVKRYLSERRRTCGIYAVGDATKQVVSVRELTIFTNHTR